MHQVKTMKGIFKWLAGQGRGVPVVRAVVALLAALGVLDASEAMLGGDVAACLGDAVAALRP